MTYKTVNGEKIPVYSKEDLLYMIKKLQTDGRGVSDWEKTFVESVRLQLLLRDLSDKQILILDRVYTEKTI